MIDQRYRAIHNYGVKAFPDCHMVTPLEKKSTIDEIRDRFDKDVERFSNIETGQTATMDAPLAMELITNAAVSSRQPIKTPLFVVQRT